MSFELTGNPKSTEHGKSRRSRQVESIGRQWTSLQKTVFRISFVYFVALCIPAYGNFYRDLIQLFDFTKLTYHDFQAVVAFWPPQFILIESEEGVFGIYNYINLILLLLVAIVVGMAWTFFDKKATQYSKLYYWARVLVRYRLAYGMIGWGLKKAFPMQMVYPTIGMLNTPFVDMAEKKLYWSHVGVSFGYTVFLGFAEILPGLLLLHRKTASLGGALAAVVCLNICIANHAYDAGVAVPAAYFTLLGFFVAWYDLPKIGRLLVGRQNVMPYRYYPVLTGSQNKLRLGVKLFFNTVFLPVAAAFWAYGFFNGNNYNIPSTPGIEGIQGVYHVSDFKLNGESLPYSPDDSVRWHDAVFESWSTLSYSTNRTALIDRMIGYSPLRVKGDRGESRYNQVNTQDSDELFKRSQNRDLGVTRWEVGGMAGDRRYFFYELDTANRILNLQNKNRNHRDETQRLHISRPTADRVVLSGINEFRDSIYVVLERVVKKYPLVEGRGNAIAQF